AGPGLERRGGAEPGPAPAAGWAPRPGPGGRGAAHLRRRAEEAELRRAAPPGQRPDVRARAQAAGSARPHRRRGPGPLLEHLSARGSQQGHRGGHRAPAEGRGRGQEASHPHPPDRGAVRLGAVAERVPRGAARRVLRPRRPASQAGRARWTDLPDLAPRPSGAPPGTGSTPFTLGDAVMSPAEPPKSPRVIELTVDLPADPDTLWRLLTDPAGLAQWFAPKVEGSGEPGGTLRLSWGSEMTWSTRVVAAERGRLVRWQDDFDAYQQLPPTPAPVVIEWQLSAGPGGTRLRLVHSGFGDGPDWDDMYDGTQAGWTFFMWHLLETVRHHLRQQRTVVFERRPSTLTREALGARLFGAEGLALTPPRPEAGSAGASSPHRPARPRGGPA